jgi:hypothetical protein
MCGGTLHTTDLSIVPSNPMNTPHCCVATPNYQQGSQQRAGLGIGQTALSSTRAVAQHAVPRPARLPASQQPIT